MEGLIEGVEEIAGDHENEDPAAMTFILHRLRHRFGIPCSNSHAIINILKESSGILCIALASQCVIPSVFPLTLGRTAHPMKGNKDAIIKKLRYTGVPSATCQNKSKSS